MEAGVVDIRSLSCCIRSNCERVCFVWTLSLFFFSFSLRLIMSASASRFPSEPEFFRSLSLPAEIDFSSSWANCVTTADAFTKEIGHQFGAPTPLKNNSCFDAKRRGAPSVASDLQHLLSGWATLPSDPTVFASAGDRYVRLAEFPVRTCLVVARVYTDASTLSPPFITVVGCPVVPLLGDTVLESTVLPLDSGKIQPLGLSCPSEVQPLVVTVAKDSREMALDQLFGSSYTESTLVALDGLEFTRPFLATAPRADKPPTTSPWASLWLAAGPEMTSKFAADETPTPLITDPAVSPDAVDFWLIGAAMPIPSSLRLPLGFVAEPAKVTSASDFAEALSAWSHLPVDTWAALQCGPVDAWFAAAHQDPQAMAVSFCSVKQISASWDTWAGIGSPAPTVDLSVLTVFQHLRCSFLHRLVHDRALATVTSSFVTQLATFEERALAVFRLGEKPLGDLVAELQAYLYVLGSADWPVKLQETGIPRLATLPFVPALASARAVFQVPLKKKDPFAAQPLASKHSADPLAASGSANPPRLTARSVQEAMKAAWGVSSPPAQLQRGSTVRKPNALPSRELFPKTPNQPARHVDTGHILGP